VTVAGLPATVNRHITRGDRDQFLIKRVDQTDTPIDITGRTYRAQIRTTAESPTIVATYQVTVTSAVEGLIEFWLGSATTAALVAGQRYVYDVEETSSPRGPDTLIRGTVTVEPDVTR
jgi:hypothetical protein